MQLSCPNLELCLIKRSKLELDITVALCSYLNLALTFAIKTNFFKTPKLDKWEKKLSAFRIVSGEFNEFDKSPNSRFYQITRFITFAIIALDDIMDEAVPGHETEELQNEILALLKQNLESLEFTTRQKAEITKNYHKVVNDIALDASINSGNITGEAIHQMRCGGYPSTLVGIAIIVGLLQNTKTSDSDLLQDQNFNDLITQVTQLARICDDIVSQVDARNLVWEVTYLERSFKAGLKAATVANIVTELEKSIKTAIINLEFDQAEGQFVQKIAFFYLEYLKSWLARSTDTNCAQLYRMIQAQ